ncbi:hypothetical protein [Candidatus Accumulibacter cognatus]|nr:hypothetical protein [Candidatus Accumulibacter cognatus]
MNLPGRARQRQQRPYGLQNRATANDLPRGNTIAPPSAESPGAPP